MFKSKFNILYENVMRSLILESGIAIKGISRIMKENIGPTLDLLQDKVFTPLGIKREWWDVLGSTGKKPSSGDLDVAINLKEVFENTDIKDKESYGAALTAKCEELGWQYNNRLKTGFDIFHMGIPIVGQDGEIAQLDLMSSYNMKYSKFKFFSPSPEESKYKGAIRGQLLNAILKFCTISANDPNSNDPYEFTDEKGHLHQYPSHTFKYVGMAPNGFNSTTKTFNGKKGVVKVAKKVSSAEFAQDPQEAIDKIFGEGVYKESDFNSFESIWNNVLMDPNFKFKDKMEPILKSFAAQFREGNPYQLEDHKMEFPEVVVQYGKEHGIDIEGVLNEK